MRGPARKAKAAVVDYRKLADVGKGVSFFASAAYAEGKKAKKAAAAPKKAADVAAKKPADAKKKKRSSGPTYTHFIREAIVLKGKPVKGASAVAITSYLKEKHPTKSDPVHIRLALKRGVKDGSLVRTGGSYRLAAGIAATVGVKKVVVRKPKAAAAPAGAAAAPAGAAAAAAAPKAKKATKKAAATPKPAGAGSRVTGKPKAKVFDNKTDAPESSFKWQFHDAKFAGGWGDYESKASDVVEAAYQEWLKNPYTDVRAVHSGDWNYSIDFTNNKQVNIQHEAHTQRDIRRVKK